MNDKKREDWLVSAKEKWVNLKILLLRKALKNSVPPQCIWRTAYDSEQDEMPEYGTQAWIHDRLKYSHLGLFAAEKNKIF